MVFPRSQQFRLRLIFVVLVFIFLGIIARLFYWQIINGGQLRGTAALQYQDYKKIPAKRGDILSTDETPIVVNQPSYLVYAEPPHVEDAALFSSQVAAVLNLKQSDIATQVSTPGKQWVPLSRSVDVQTKQKLDALHLKGLGYESGTQRYYPEASMAANLLGFVGLDDNGNQKGYFGVEGYYDRELSGQQGSLSDQQDAQGNPILIGNQTRINPQDGRSLVLWLDRSIQFIAEKRLSEGMQQYGVDNGSVVIMDPKTGGILAMASFPSYDPAKYAQYDDSLYKNPLVASTYEPGSTFKPLIMSAAINEKLVDAKTIVNESGPITIGEYTVRTWNDQYHGQITTTQILQYSSNVGMVSISRLLGKERMISYIQNFGVGQLTNVDLQDESSPQLRPISTWADIDYATSSFGQGIAVTPLQIVRGIGALANGGWIMEPHVVKEIVDKQGKTLLIKDKKIRQVISAQAASQIKDMMVDAVKFGEAKFARPKGYKVAGKTGTAQIPVAGHYDPTKTIASFVGFAPADNPRFVMLVVLSQPKTSPWGAETAAPLFFTISKDLFAYMGISPTGDD